LSSHFYINQFIKNKYNSDYFKNKKGDSNESAIDLSISVSNFNEAQPIIVSTVDINPEKEESPADNSISEAQLKATYKNWLQKDSSETSIGSNHSIDSKLIHNEMFNSTDSLKDFEFNRENKKDNDLLCPIKDNDVSKNSSISIESGEKLKIQSVVEVVGFLLFPSAGLTNLAFKELLIEINLFESFK
jgi:hypothetical protein